MQQEEILTMGYMKLKKWLVLQGCEPDQVSKCMSYEALLEIAEQHGFLQVPKAPEQPRLYHGHLDTVVNYRDKKTAVLLSGSHPSNTVGQVKHVSPKVMERLEYRHQG